MIYIFKVCMKELIQKKIKVFISFSQFTLVFTLVFILSGLINSESDMNSDLKNGIGGDTWIIRSHIVNLDLLKEEKIPSPWTESQFNFLKEYYGEKLQFSIIVNDSGSGDNYQTKLKTMYLSRGLFDKMGKLVNNQNVKYLYSSYSNTVLNSEIKPLDTSLKINPSLLETITSSNLHTNFLIMPSDNIPWDKNIYIDMILVGITSQDIDIKLSDKLSKMNTGFTYTIEKSIKHSIEQNEDQKLLNSIALIFTVIAALIFFIGVIGFSLVQFLFQQEKIFIFRILGAKRRHLWFLFFMWNASIITPPYIFSMCLFIYIRNAFVPQIEYNLSILTGTMIWLLLLFVATIPLLKINHNQNLVGEMRGI